MIEFSPLKIRSTYSIQRSTNRPWQTPLLAQRVGAKAFAVADYGSMSGLPAVAKACQDACRHCGWPSDRHAEGGKGACVVKGAACPGYEAGGARPIFGSDFWVTAKPATDKSDENKRLTRLPVLARNKQGWKALVKATTAANRPEHFDAHPRLSAEELAKHAAGSWVVLVGGVRSALADACFLDPEAAYAARTRDEALSLLKPQRELKAALRTAVGGYREMFGRDNVRLDISLMDAANRPAAGLLVTAMRWLGQAEGLSLLACPDVHYPTPDDAADQRVMLANSEDVNLSLEEVHRDLQQGKFVAHGEFFRSRNYYLPSASELLAAGHTEAELSATMDVAELCEAVDIFGKPVMPTFDCPGGKSADEYLRELCREGWKRKVQGKVPKEKHQVYADRVKMELGVFSAANLAAYFLVTEDYIRYSHKELHCWPSRGRGSAAGSLVSHLLDITDCDPIKYDLSFERFYDDSRNDPKTGKVSLPDIDSDFPPDKRDQVIAYVRKKYGADRVAHLATFSELRGREAITAVLRAHGWGTFQERKDITKVFPDTAKIADQLQEMLEADGEATITGWTLEHRAKDLAEWVTVGDDGSLSGPLARHFEQAMRLEGVKKAQGRHPSAVVIFPYALDEMVPLVHDKSSEHLVVGLDMYSAEGLGVPKFDFLGLAALSKLQAASEFARYGRRKS